MSAGDERVEIPEDLFDDPAVLDLTARSLDHDSRAVRGAVAGGADPNGRGIGGVTPLLWVCAHGDGQAADLLIRVGAATDLADDDGRSPVLVAATASDPSALKVLLDAGCDPDARHWRTGERATEMATMAGAIDCLRGLLDAGADVEFTEGDSDSLLHVAGQVNATAAILELLDAGLDPSARNDQGLTFMDYLLMTPLELLTEQSQREVRRIADRVSEAGQQS